MKKVTNPGGNIRLRNRGHKRGYVITHICHCSISLFYRYLYLYISKVNHSKKTIKIIARENINVFILVYLGQKEIDKQKHLIIKRN